jgi:beta-glucosidase/6-phospho-beta-glucosidase/beta-galactosidase
VLPEGRGPVNRRGLDFYDRLVDGLLARGISPVATLYHWDLPHALQDHGGWENRDSAEWFANEGRGSCCHRCTDRLPRGQLLHARRNRRSGAPSPTPSITENGVPDDPTDSSQPTADHARVDFLRRHLRALHQAIGEGCRVTGYHAWSLLDNFEWAAGYTQRWGLVRVDFSTLARCLKTSASWYSAVARSNSLPGE